MARCTKTTTHKNLHFISLEFYLLYSAGDASSVAQPAFEFSRCIHMPPLAYLMFSAYTSRHLFLLKTLLLYVEKSMFNSLLVITYKYDLLRHSKLPTKHLGINLLNSRNFHYLYKMLVK